MTARNVVLIGSMGSGKSTVGAALAARLSYELVDTDALVEREAGRSIEEIWANGGEPAFRALEHQAVLRACAGSGRVISCGGGAILQLTNFGILKDAGAVVYLRAPAEVLWERVRAAGGRPLATDEHSFRKLLADRTPVYESAADHVVDVDGDEPDAVARHIAELVA
ncbi:MAG TPA: shikimate kinase [Actinomycetota bacterium]